MSMAVVLMMSQMTATVVQWNALLVKKYKRARSQWLTPVILATQEERSG
jgi:hypothetical protein